MLCVFIVFASVAIAYVLWRKDADNERNGQYDPKIRIAALIFTLVAALAPIYSILTTDPTQDLNSYVQDRMSRLRR
jgi:hypothetical protein